MHYSANKFKMIVKLLYVILFLCLINESQVYAVDANSPLHNNYQIVQHTWTGNNKIMLIKTKSGNRQLITFEIGKDGSITETLSPDITFKPLIMSESGKAFLVRDRDYDYSIVVNNNRVINKNIQNAISGKFRKQLAVDNQYFPECIYVSEKSALIQLKSPNKWQAPVSFNIKKSDITDWRSLILKLKEHNTPEINSVWNLVKPEIRQEIEKWQQNQEIPEDLKGNILFELNRIIENPDFYDKAFHKYLPIHNTYALKLYKKGLSNLNQNEIRQFNKLIIETEMFEKIIKPSYTLLSYSQDFLISGSKPIISEIIKKVKLLENLGDSFDEQPVLLSKQNLFHNKNIIYAVGPKHIYEYNIINHTLKSILNFDCIPFDVQSVVVMDNLIYICQWNDKKQFLYVYDSKKNHNIHKWTDIIDFDVSRNYIVTTSWHYITVEGKPNIKLTYEIYDKNSNHMIFQDNIKSSLDPVSFLYPVISPDEKYILIFNCYDDTKPPIVIHTSKFRRK